MWGWGHYCLAEAVQDGLLSKKDDNCVWNGERKQTIHENSIHIQTNIQTDKQIIDGVYMDLAPIPHLTQHGVNCTPTVQYSYEWAETTCLMTWSTYLAQLSLQLCSEVPYPQVLNTHSVVRPYRHTDIQTYRQADVQTDRTADTYWELKTSKRSWQNSAPALVK